MRAFARYQNLCIAFAIAALHDGMAMRCSAMQDLSQVAPRNKRWYGIRCRHTDEQYINTYNNLNIDSGASAACMAVQQVASCSPGWSESQAKR